MKHNTGVRHSDATKALATELRHTGLSINKIAKQLNIAESTASAWLRNIQLTPEQSQNLLVLKAQNSRQLNRDRAFQRYQQWHIEAVDFFNAHKDETLFMLGIGLYWGEGGKAYKTLVLTNSDPALIKVWVDWCKTYIPKVELRGGLALHKNLDCNIAKAYWQKLSSIEKIYIMIVKPVASKGRRAKNILPNGTFRVVAGVGSAEWHTKMMKWIEILGN